MPNITLKTLPLATAQQVFEQIASHLLTQNKKSMDNVYCSYLNPKGLKCAAGCLIGGNEYSSIFEKNTWYYLVEEGLVPNNHKEIISHAQSIHDSRGPSAWKEELIILAEKFKLDHSFLNNLPKCII